jgi:protein-S-isoprenylcysteine O-methyltransferase Ste14
MLPSRVNPPVYLLAALSLMVVLHLALPLATVFRPPWILLGLPPLLLGVIANLWSSRAFDAARTTVKPFEEPTSLLTHGCFRISRHPMYVGMVLLTFGIAVLLGTLTPLLVVALLAWVLSRFMRFEEEKMVAAFGDEYQEYRRRVRRWI